MQQNTAPLYTAARACGAMEGAGARGGGGDAREHSRGNDDSSAQIPVSLHGAFHQHRVRSPREVRVGLMEPNKV